MSTTNRLNVVPTVTVLAVIKNRLAGAQKGYKLLKKKADALTMRYRQILTKIVAAKQRMGATMKASAFALTEAKYVAGEGIKHTVLDAVEQANVRVRAHTDNVAGVKLPRFEHYLEGAEAKSDMTGLGGGGKQLQNCKRAYLGAVQLLVELASLQTAFITLDVAIKTTNRRVQRAGKRRHAEAREHRAVHQGRARRAGARGVLPSEKVQAKKKKDIEANESAARKASAARAAPPRIRRRGDGAFGRRDAGGRGRRRRPGQPPRARARRGSALLTERAGRRVGCARVGRVSASLDSPRERNDGAVPPREKRRENAPLRLVPSRSFFFRLYREHHSISSSHTPHSSTATFASSLDPPAVPNVTLRRAPPAPPPSHRRNDPVTRACDALLPSKSRSRSAADRARFDSVAFARPFSAWPFSSWPFSSWPFSSWPFSSWTSSVAASTFRGVFDGAAKKMSCASATARSAASAGHAAARRARPPRVAPTRPVSWTILCSDPVAGSLPRVFVVV